MNRSRTEVSIVAIAILLLAAGSVSIARYSGGTGEPNTPYRIADANDMNEIGLHSEDWDSHFVLVNDINLAEFTGAQFNIIGNISPYFRGVFDGNSHEISNFNYHISGVAFVNDFGLFGVLYSNAEIRDLGLRNVDVRVSGEHVQNVGALAGAVASGNNRILDCYSEQGSVIGQLEVERVGGLVGYVTDGGKIENCHASVNVSGENRRIGGLAGANNGHLLNCYATGDVSGSGTEIGGLVGNNGLFSGAKLIEHCYATGNISGEEMAGGLVGILSAGTIVNCRAEGTVYSGLCAGGLVGMNYGTIRKSLASGYVSGRHCIGGLVGANGSAAGSGTVEESFALGMVSANGIAAGGLVGASFRSTISKCYSTGNVSGSANPAGGLAGRNYANARISKCYSVGSASGSGIVGGLVGDTFDGATVANSFWDVNSSGLETSDGGTGNTTTEMQMESTFTDAGWDFVEVWGIGQGQTYP